MFGVNQSPHVATQNRTFFTRAIPIPMTLFPWEWDSHDGNGIPMGIHILMHTFSLDIATIFHHLQLCCSGTVMRGNTPRAFYPFLFPPSAAKRVAGMQCRPMRGVTSTARFVASTTLF